MQGRRYENIGRTNRTRVPPTGEFRRVPLDSAGLSFKTRGKIPSIHAILERATTLASVSQTAQAVGILSMYLRPPTDKFGFLEAESIETIADLDYQFARPDLGVWMETRSFTPMTWIAADINPVNCCHDASLRPQDWRSVALCLETMPKPT